MKIAFVVHATPPIWLHHKHASKFRYNYSALLATCRHPFLRLRYGGRARIRPSLRIRFVREDEEERQHRVRVLPTPTCFPPTNTSLFLLPFQHARVQQFLGSRACSLPAPRTRPTAPRPTSRRFAPAGAAASRKKKIIFHLPLPLRRSSRKGLLQPTLPSSYSIFL